jgi:hypothetical protein
MLRHACRLVIALRAITIISVVACVVSLAANDKPVWCELIVLGILDGRASYRYAKD